MGDGGAGPGGAPPGRPRAGPALTTAATVVAVVSAALLPAFNIAAGLVAGRAEEALRATPGSDRATVGHVAPAFALAVAIYLAIHVAGPVREALCSALMRRVDARLTVDVMRGRQLPDADDDAAVTRATERAAAGDLPGLLPDGLGTMLGREFEAGTELSIGQWQKVAVARAMMRVRPLLLVLDEPTASLDATTEHELFDHFTGAARAAARRTGAVTVLVSHRFSTVRTADQVLVVAGNRVAEAGTHDELMARGGGLYAELYGLQARSYS